MGTCCTEAHTSCMHRRSAAYSAQQGVSSVNRARLLSTMQLHHVKATVVAILLVCCIHRVDSAKKQLDWSPCFLCLPCRSGAAAVNVNQQRSLGTVFSKCAPATGAASLTARTAMAGMCVGTSSTADIQRDSETVWLRRCTCLKPTGQAGSNAAACPASALQI